MYLGNKRSNKLTEKGRAIAFASDADEPTVKTAKHEVYLHSGDELRDPSNNARNMFDDSNIEDRKWFGSAKKYLSRLDRL
jgi:hypothetical protein